MKPFNNFQWLGLSFIVIILDQWTKYLAIKHLTLFHHYHVLSFFDLSLTYNTGSAFSLLNMASGWQRWFLSGFAIFMCTFILIWLGRTAKTKHLSLLGLSCIFGGAIGNLIDRIRLGYVIDFIDLYIKNWHWPIFNIADMAISTGVTILIIAILFEKKQPEPYH